MASVRRRRCGVVRADFHYDPVVDVGRQIPSEVVEGPKEARESEGPRNCPVVCPGAGLQGTVHEGTPKKAQNALVNLAQLKNTQALTDLA